MAGTCREIGGYLELERYPGCGFYPDAVALNCGRGCLAYEVELRGILRMWVPTLMCGSVPALLVREGVEVLSYEVGRDLAPVWEAIAPSPGDWLLLVDYYGQLTSSTVEQGLSRFPHAVLVDETQGFFRPDWPGADTMRTCRKWFGVADGAYLSTWDGARLPHKISRDESHGRYGFVLGRVERPAGEFYAESVKNNVLFAMEPARMMSPVTESLLAPIDYTVAKTKRNTNWATLDSAIGHLNKLTLQTPDGAFMYPFMVDGAQEVREKLIERGVFVPVLWPNVLEEQPAGSWARRMAEDVLPLPLDQRYGKEEMEYVASAIMEAVD